MVRKRSSMDLIMVTSEKNIYFAHHRLFDHYFQKIHIDFSMLFSKTIQMKFGRIQKEKKDISRKER